MGQQEAVTYLIFENVERINHILAYNKAEVYIKDKAEPESLYPVYAVGYQGKELISTPYFRSCSHLFEFEIKFDPPVFAVFNSVEGELTIFKEKPSV
jgi:hypothetical protein